MMNKRKAISLLQEFGDAIIYLTNRQPIAVTTDFSTPYIKNIRRYQRFQFKGNILVFNWTDNKFEAIPVKTLKSITPLSSILNNTRDEDTHG